MRLSMRAPLLLVLAAALAGCRAPSALSPDAGSASAPGEAAAADAARAAALALPPTATLCPFDAYPAASEIFSFDGGVDPNEPAGNTFAPLCNGVSVVSDLAPAGWCC
jgi:hypothetical protein